MIRSPRPDPATVGGVHGWQIILVAIGAVLAGAVLAVLYDRPGPHGRHGSPRTSAGPDRGRENQIMTAETGTMGDELLVTDLVTRAKTATSRHGTRSLSGTPRWSGPLPQAPARRRRSQRRRPDRMAAARGRARTVNDQATLPGWLATATLRECGRVLRTAGRQQAAEYMLDAGDIPGGPAG